MLPGFWRIIRVVLMNIDYVNGPAGEVGINKLTTWPVLYWSMIITILVVVNLINPVTAARSCPFARWWRQN